MSKTTDSLTSTCVLCCQGIKIYAIGPCNHHICFKCSTKMRVICNQMYCAVCRTEMPKAIFTNKLHPFDGIICHKFPNDRKYGIFFATTRIQEEYRKILAHKCQICGIKREPDSNFRKLQDHMRKDHGLYSCKLCVDNIKVLSSERKFYTRKELAQHRRSGDPDDTSYRGHPICEFCDERYFDNDELLRHLRKDHFFCHFCETDGVTNQFYGEYEDLEDHFRTDHFLCEEDTCRQEKFTGAFRTEIDLKAHKTRCHSGKMTKFQSKQNRQVDIEINLPARQREYQRGHRDGAYGGGARGGRNRYQRDRNERDTEMAIEASLETAQREETERQKERKKKMVVKHQKEERRTRMERQRPDSPVEAIQPKTEMKNKIKVMEDKENEILKPPGADSLVSNGDSYASNLDKKAPDISDFPVLAEPAPAFQMGGKWSAAPRRTEDDFPSLGNGDGSVSNAPLNVASSFGFYSSLVVNKPPPTTSTVEPSHTALVGTEDDAEFPTLSSIASLLGGNQKKNKTKKNKKKQAQTHSANQDSNVMKYSSVTESSKVSEPENVGAKTESTVDKPTTTVPSKPSTIISSSQAPSVSSDSSTARPPPPGFAAFPSLSSSSIHAPPPGFSSSSSTIQAPPPGFSSFSTSTSSGPEFVQPPNFKQRNRDLVMKIQDFCFGDDELFDQFKQDSGEFRQGMISAREYYRRCIQTLSEENFQGVFNELVTLLPDLAKQQELLAAHNDYKAAKSQKPKDTVLKISNTKPSKSGSKAAWKSSTGKGESRSVCSVCSQIVLTRDLGEHMNVHEDFPALSSSRAKSRPVPAAAWAAPTWGRGK